MKIAKINRALLLIAALGAVASFAPIQRAAHAQDQDNTAAQQRPNEPRRGFGGPGAPPPWWFRGGRGGQWQPSDEEWVEMSAFMKQYSPKRWEVYQKLSPDKQQSLRQIVGRRYRLMQWVRNSDPELYELQKNRWILGDEIFGLTQEVKTSSSDLTRQKLKEKIGQSVDLGIQERNIRVARWEKMIANERDMIARETRDREEIIHNRMRALREAGGDLGDEPDATTQESDSPRAPAIAAPTTAPSK
jgi:hypothetical protein